MNAFVLKHYQFNKEKSKNTATFIRNEYGCAVFNQIRLRFTVFLFFFLINSLA